MIILICTATVRKLLQRCRTNPAVRCPFRGVSIVTPPVPCPRLNLAFSHAGRGLLVRRLPTLLKHAFQVHVLHANGGGDGGVLDDRFLPFQLRPRRTSRAGVIQGGKPWGFSFALVENVEDLSSSPTNSPPCPSIPALKACLSFCPWLLPLLSECRTLALYVRSVY